MCPAPAKTSQDDIVAAARGLIEQSGAAALSMQAVAEAVGIRGPSLYKRFADRDRLLDSVARGALAELTAKLVAARDRAPAGEEIIAMAHAYRKFAKRSPPLYALVFDPRAEGEDLHAARAAAVKPLFELLRTWVKDDDVLPAARLLTAFLHGFVSMETAGAFRLGGDVQHAFDFSLAQLTVALRSEKREKRAER